MKQALLIGKLRGLQHCPPRRGALAVMAIDHRHKLGEARNPANLRSVTDADMIEIRRQAPAWPWDDFFDAETPGGQWFQTYSKLITAP